MLKSISHFTLVAGAALLVASVFAAESQAQFRVNPVNRGGLTIYPTTGTLPNRNYMVAPYTTLNQYAFNVRTLGRAYSQVPPYALGYNPYPNPIFVNSYPVVYPNYTTYNPYLYSNGNPYTSPYGNPYVSPYGIYR